MKKKEKKYIAYIPDGIPINGRLVLYVAVNEKDSTDNLLVVVKKANDCTKKRN